MSMQPKICQHCHHFRPDSEEGESSGQCRLNPPVPMVAVSDEDVAVFSTFPEVDPGDYCSKWEQAHD